MSKYQKLFLLVIALTILSAVICVMKPINRGLDIAGGLRVVMQIAPKPGEWPAKSEDRRAKMQTIAETMRRRVQGVGGVTEPIVRVENADSNEARLVIELPGTENNEDALAKIRQTARLEFFYMKDVQTPVNPLGQWKMSAASGDEKEYVFTGPRGETLSTADLPTDLPTNTMSTKANDENRKKNEDNTKRNDENKQKILDDVIGKGVKPILTGAYLLATAKSALKPTTNEAIIEIQFNPEGSTIFSDFTGKHVGEILGVFYDGKLLTAPRINEKISEGKAEVSGFPSLREATRVAEFLNAGALPVDLTVIGQDTVEPSLGKVTIARVLVAGIAGLILVLLFMALYYRLPGLLADIALALYALFTIAVFKMLGVTLSLAGMAALIISIGMAVDANILIFERLKEELRSGKTLRSAIDAGFGRAFTAIFDSNMCTAITCAVLIWLGTPTVTSFALTLLVGVGISMFTAITVTRTFLHLLVNWEWAQNPALYGLSTGKIASSGWDIVGKRNWFFALSAALIVPGVITLYMYHLRPGIEFTSGTTIQASFQQVVKGNDVRSAVNAISPDSEVQLVEKGKTAYITTKMLSEQPSFKGNVEDIKNALNDKFHLATMGKDGKPALDSVSSVGPTISKELTVNAVRAVILASILIVVYLTFRFAIGGVLTGLKYGTCAVIALIHDAFFILGGFAILGHWLKWETDSLFVTAVLTIIGFSVHDTIVVFDRIRENLRHRQRGESFEQLANRSILQTLSRSINTSFTVVMTLATLVIFGGPLLRHFYITLMAGIIIGTYSSIFNATPLVIVWDKIGSKGKTPRKRAVVEERPLVDKSPSNGGGSETEAIDSVVDDKPAQTAKSARPKRKKKRF